MLVLVGLPTLFPKLVEARTFAERMFRVVFLDRLIDQDCRDAILKPIDDAQCPVELNENSIRLIVTDSGGYPYFIQFICREVYDVFLERLVAGENAVVPRREIMRKLDTLKVFANMAKDVKQISDNNYPINNIFTLK